jgi:glycosyltransferase involved in cell wall biosynthesis
VRASSGPLIAFLDDDDSWRPEKLERQVAVLVKSDESVAAVETGFDLWRDGRLVLRYVPEADRDLARTLLEKPCLQPSTVLLRRSAFEALGGFDTTLRRVEDWELWVRFADLYGAAVIPEVHVDREESHPADELEWYREFVRRMKPRIDSLPPEERDRIGAVHMLVEAHLLFERGEAREGRSRALLALRTYPRCWRRSVLYLARSVLGRRAWSAGKRTLVRLRRSRNREADVR